MEKAKHGLSVILLQIHVNNTTLTDGTVVEGDDDVARYYAILPVCNSESVISNKYKMGNEINKRRLQRIHAVPQESMGKKHTEYNQNSATQVLVAPQ